MPKPICFGRASIPHWRKRGPERLVGPRIEPGPQCVRLALVYALLDGSAVVGAEHVRAALAMWAYCCRCPVHTGTSAMNDDQTTAAAPRVATQHLQPPDGAV